MTGAIDLSHIVSARSPAALAARDAILALDRMHGHRRRYDPGNIECDGVRLPCGVSAAVAFARSRPPRGNGEDAFATELSVGRNRYRLAVRARPYTPRHFIVATETRLQDDVREDEIELLLQLALVLGSDFEVFYNGIAPTWPTFHLQIIERRTTAWGASDRWPACFEELPGGLEDLREEIAQRLSALDHIQCEDASPALWCDLIARFDGDNGRVLLIPRRIGEVRPPRWDVEALSGGAVGSVDYATWGALEMAGFFLATNSVPARDLLRTRPELYELGLRSFSL
jgi:hypothetical protein